MFRSGGLASGIDTNSMVQQLVAIERLPIKTLEGKKSSHQAQLSAIGQVKSSLSTLISKMKELDTNAELLTLTGTSTDENALTATATGAAANASYTMEVTQLARAAKHRSGALSGNTAEITAGTLTIQVKGGAAQELVIAEGETLADVAARFNDEIEGASATVISDGTNSYLSITSDNTGHTVGGDPSEALVITENYTGGSGSQLGLTEVQSAQNAKVLIDQLPVESENNEISTALTGVTLKLKDLTKKPETLTIAADSEAIEETIQAFVDAYNSSVDLITKQTTITSGTDRTKTLAGDATIRGLRSVLSNAVTSPVGSLSGAEFDSLSSIGITTGTGGKLKINSDKLSAALAKSTTRVAKVFTAADGLSKSMISTIQPYTEVNGILSARTDGINAAIKNIDTRILDMEFRVDKYEQNLLRQFAALEQSVSQISAQGSYLSGAL